MSGGNLAFPMSISATSRRTINPTASWCRSRWRWGHDNRSRNASTKRAKLLRDHSGQALTYIHYESDKLLSKDEARRIAANVAKLRELLSRQLTCLRLLLSALLPNFVHCGNERA